MAEIEGIDLVTEGVLTLGKSLKLLKKYVRDEFDEEFFAELDADNGASRLAKLLIEECTELHLFVGTAVNDAHKESELNFDLSMNSRALRRSADPDCEGNGKDSDSEVLLNLRLLRFFDRVKRPRNAE